MKRKKTLFQLLKDGHRKISDLLERNEASIEKPWKVRRHLFSALMDELESHSRLETELLYPLLAQDKDARQLVTEAEMEHEMIDNLVTKLDGSFPLTEKDSFDFRWLSQFAILKESVEYHFSIEETELLPLLAKSEEAAA